MAKPVNTYGKVYCLSISPRKGTRKENTDKVTLVEHFGIKGDAHAGSKRQVSLLPYEAFGGVRKLLPDIRPGDFAENITTLGINLSRAAVGDRLRIGADARLVITQIGKECHNDCEIKKAVGDCIMPRLGVFAAIEKGGSIGIGDRIEWDNDND